VYAAIGTVVVVLVSIFLALRRRGRKGTARPVPVATISQRGSVQIVSPEAAEKLQRLKRMLDLRLITQEDYEEQLKRLHGDVRSPWTASSCGDHVVMLLVKA